MNINQKAQELAKLIKTTDEFKTMNRYKREIEKNKNIKRQLDSYLNKKDKIYTKHKIDEANRKVSQLDREYSKVFQNPLVENYFKSTQNFNLLMQSIYKSIEEELLRLYLSHLSLNFIIIKFPSTMLILYCLRLII